MYDDPTILKLTHLWPELPRLSGADWPQIYWQLEQLVRRYRTCRTDDDRAVCSIEIRKILLSRPTTRAEWHAASADGLAARSRGLGDDRDIMASTELTRDAPFDTDGILPGGVPIDIQELLGQSSRLRRWTDVLAPHRVQVGARFPVIVGLTRKPTDVASQSLLARTKQTVRVVIKSGSLEVLGERFKDVVVETDKDSEPAVFYFQAPTVGSHDLLIDFWLDGELVASQTATIAAMAEPTIDAPEARSGASLALERTGIPFPDLLLRVTTAGNGLRFDLNFADTRFVQIEGPRLRTDPQQFRVDLLREIETLAKAPGKSHDYLAKQLEKIGQRLYRDLFPQEFRREYRQFASKVRTLHIVSDEPYIPWELVKPYDDDPGGPLVDDDFWCARFDMARWVCPAAASVPAARIHVSSAICIVPTDSGLAQAQQERKDFEAWSMAAGVPAIIPDPATLEAVETSLLGDQPVQLWHFACHGNIDVGAPNKSPLRLANNDRFRPDDLIGKAQTRLKTDRPFVFLNACRVGTGGMSLTGLGGWASVLIGHCGVGALIAPQWTITDELAREFARRVYEQIRTVPGCTIARAVREARHEIREKSRQDPTWLAYSLYAHPNTHVSLGK